ncbi:MAG: mechanosensitive ion channel family protein [bacterium]
MKKHGAIQVNRGAQCVSTRTALRGLAAAAGCLFIFAVSALGQDPEHPLKPPDRSSPRAALKTFLDSGDAVGVFMTREYFAAPSRARFRQMVLLSETTLRGLDMSEVPPAARLKRGRAAATALYETLSRIQLPPFDEIPGADQVGRLASTNALQWTIPDTEIVLARSSSGEFLFSAQTVAKAGEFYERVRRLPYTRPVPFDKVQETLGNGGGWLVPYAWIHAMPLWLLSPLANEPVWKWMALALVLSVFMLLLRLAFRLSHRGSRKHPFLRALAQLALPAYFLAAMPAVAYLALVQINLRGNTGSDIELAVTAIMYFCGAWLSWRAAPVVAEAIISSPRITPEGVDAHLIRLCTRLLGLVAWAVFLVMGADRLGIPAYGVVAGLGVGGLAIALAAQPTIENLIGGLSLFADKPVRVGDLCRCGTDEGTVEAIGLRSTRIRGVDRTLTTIPNAVLSKMSIENFAERDRFLIQSVIGVRCETSPEQLHFLLIKIREMLLGHPRVLPELVRVRLIGFGASSLDIEVFAYVTTRDKVEFLGIQEELWLRVMDIVAQSGTGLAFPSQTLYFARDRGLDADKTEVAEAAARQWREAGEQKSGAGSQKSE